LADGAAVVSFNAWRVAVLYVEDTAKATLAEFDKEEAEWRKTAERQVSNLCAIEDPLPTTEELDELDPGEAIRRIETVVENNAQLCVAAEGDTRSWGEMAVARVRARTEAKPKTVANRQQSEKDTPWQ
jgi:hypothetical protein